MRRGARRPSPHGRRRARARARRRRARRRRSAGTGARCWRWARPGRSRSRRPRSSSRPGTRPLGRAELGLAGYAAGGRAARRRPRASWPSRGSSGRPGRSVIGGGGWAARAVAALVGCGRRARHGRRARRILRVPIDADRSRSTSGSRPLAVGGDPQVERLECDGAAFDCDGIVLAHGLVPVRNVDGAVSDGERTVYAQPTRGSTVRGRRSRAAGGRLPRQHSRITGGAATIGPWSSSPNSPPSA